jgi:hypothetical protein
MPADNPEPSASPPPTGRGTTGTSRAWIAASAGGVNVGSWIAGPPYGLTILSIQLLLTVLVLTLVVTLPEDRSNRIFRLTRLLLNRVEQWDSLLPPRPIQSSPEAQDTMQADVFRSPDTST